MKVLCITFILFVFSLSSIAQTQLLTFDIEGRDIDYTLPVRNVIDEGANGVTVSYLFPGAAFYHKISPTDTFQFLNIEGFSHTQEVGKPAMPVHSDLILIPENAKYQIQVTLSNSSTRNNFLIYPALEPASDQYGAPEPAFEMDSTYYASGNVYPESAVMIKEILKIKGLRFARIEVAPIRFNPVTKQILVYDKIEYKMTFVGSSSFISEKKNFSPNFLGNLHNLPINNSILKMEMDNYLMSPSVHQKSHNSVDYIIVTHQDYKDAADSIAQWKRQLGYNVEILSAPSWSSADVKNAVHAKYQSYTPKPDYLLIIGDHNKVPGEVINSSGATFASDLYYSCMDGSGDYVPDMAFGRISVVTLSEALTVAKKIIDYEKSPIQDSNFYKSGLNCAYFQESSTAGYAERRFAQTSEDVHAHMQTHGYDVDRVYVTGNSTQPTNWNNGNYSMGESLPSYLQKPTFAWDGDLNDIKNYLDEGRFYILHRDHGMSAGWGDPYFTNTHVGQLNNGDKLPVVFSINCLTGKYMDALCFAELFLRRTNGGAVGVFAHGEVSYSGYNDGLALGLFDAMFSSPSLVPNFTGSGGISNPNLTAHTDILTMGDVKNQGLIRMVETWGGSSSAIQYTYELFNYFGDPAMRMWTKLPSQIIASHSDTIYCAVDTTLLITTTNISSGLVTLVVDNELVASSLIVNGSATLSWNAISGTEAILTISKENAKPYIQTVVIQGGCPRANFTATANKFCLDDSVYVQDYSNGNILTYAWDFGQDAYPDTSSSIGPFYISYASGGNKTITLTVTDSNGTSSVFTYDFVMDQICSFQIPTSSHSIIQKCSGKLFDDGGDLNYTNNSNGSVTISAIGATSVSLSFTSFSFENNYDYLKIYDGSSVSSPLIGSYTGSILPNSGFITSSTGSITLLQSTDSYQSESGFELSWSCNQASVQPTAAFIYSDTISCTGLIRFIDASLNGPTGWVWEFGDGMNSTLQNPIHQYKTNGYFIVKLKVLNGYGQDSTVKTNCVYVDLPQTPVALDNKRCKPGIVKLSANYSGSGTLYWYDSLNSTTVLDTGLIFETPAIATSKTYYTELHNPSSVIATGKFDTVGNGSFFTANSSHYLVFDSYQELVLHSVIVYANTSGSRTIELQNSNGDLLQTKTVYVPAGKQKVVLNFHIPIGSNLRLVGPTSPNLYRSQGSINFPFSVSGMLEIKHSSASSNPTGYYYYFYDWEVLGDDCISLRTPVQAIINDTLQPQTQFALQNTDPVVHLTNLSKYADSYYWDFGDGDFSLLENPSHTYSADGTFTVTLTASNLCGNIVSTQQVQIISSSIHNPQNIRFVSVFPNPVQDNLTVSFDLLESQNLKFELVNSIGQVLWHKEQGFENGKSDISISLSKFARGVYHLRLHSDEGIVYRKIVHY